MALEVVGVVFAIIAPIVALVIFFLQRNIKDISWQVISNTLVLPKVDIGEQAKVRLQILFDGKEVKSLRLVVLEIGNSGNVSIDGNDFENNDPITFSFGEKAEVLNVEVLDTTSPPSIKPRAKASLKQDADKVNLEPLLLNSKDVIRFKVLLVKYTNITVSGRIKGVKQFQNTPRQSRLLLIYLTIIMLMQFIYVIIYYVVNVNPLVQVFMGLVFMIMGTINIRLVLKYMNERRRFRALNKR